MSAADLERAAEIAASGEPFTVPLPGGGSRITAAGRAHALAVIGLPADHPNETRQVLDKVARLRAAAARDRGVSGE